MRHAVPLVHQHETVRVDAGEREVVHGADDRETVLAAQPVDQLERLLLVTDVERTRGLVEKKDRRLLGDRPRDDEALPLPAGQRADVAAGEPREVQPLDDVVHHAEVMPALGAEVGHERVPPEQHVLASRHARRQHRVLRDVGDQLGAAARGTGVQRRAVHQHSPDVGGDTHNGAQQRRLARAVRADDAQPLPRPHGVAEAVHGHVAAVAHADVVEDQRRHRDPCLVRRMSRKNGAPRNAVTTPIGVSAGLSRMRPGMSATMRNAAPSIIDSGSTRR